MHKKTNIFYGIKRTLDNNKNKIIESELKKKQMKLAKLKSKKARSIKYNTSLKMNNFDASFVSKISNARYNKTHSIPPFDKYVLKWMNVKKYNIIHLAKAGDIQQEKYDRYIEFLKTSVEAMRINGWLLEKDFKKQNINMDKIVSLLGTKMKNYATVKMYYQRESDRQAGENYQGL